MPRDYTAHHSNFYWSRTEAVRLSPDHSEHLCYNTMYSPPGSVDPIQTMTTSRKQQKTAPKSQKSYQATRRQASIPSGSRPVNQFVRVNRVPRFITSRDGRKTTIYHREYIADISGTSGFTATTLAVNPGIAATFPWLSNVAKNFESYRFKKLSFEFESGKGFSADGEMIIALDYDAADAAPTTKAQIMQYQDAVIGPITPLDTGTTGKSAGVRNLSHKPNVDKMVAERFVRTGSLASNLDIKTYDVGNVNFCTNACSFTSYAGSLVVDYIIELDTPIYAAASAAVTGQAIAGVSGTINSAWLGTTPTSKGTTYVTATGNTLTFTQAGVFLVYFYTQSSTGTQSGYSYASWTGTATITAPATLTPLYVATTGITFSGALVTATSGQTVVYPTTTGSSGSWTAASVVITPATASM